MNKKLLYGILIFSLIINTILLGILAYNSFSNKSVSDKGEDNKTTDVVADQAKRQALAEQTVRKLVCDNLYYPESYDPVSTEVDSAFYGPMTDGDCVQAAYELIDLESEYTKAKETYEEKAHEFKMMGYNNFFRELRVERDNAAAKMKELSPKIKRRKDIIKNRDASRDGEFIGWVVTHRYRASTNSGNVTFGNVAYILDPEMSPQYYFRYSLDDNDKGNLEAISKVIQKELGIYVDN